jgi:protein required for attachment to host cells
MDQPITWIVVANGARGTVFERKGTTADLRPAVPSVSLSARANRMPEPQGRSAPGLAERGKVAHAGRIAALLEWALDEGRFDRLVLVAPPQLMPELNAALSSRIGHRVDCRVNHDLTALAAHELAQILGFTAPIPVAARGGAARSGSQPGV